MARHFPNWLKAYMDYCAQSEAPQHFHFWTGVSTLAGALRRKVWIDQNYFQWVPNFYIFIVGPPGIVTKSTTISIGYDLLSELDIPLGAQISTWQAIVKDLAEAHELVQVSPGKFMPMCALSTAISELGTFLDTSDPKLVDLLTGLWDGQLGTTRKSTITQGTYAIENPWLNIIGCTTPSWLRRSVDENLMTGGLASRAIWLYSDRKAQLIAYPGLRARNPTERKKLVEDLADIAKLIGEFELTKSAIQWGEAWYTKHYQLMLASASDDSLSGYISRKQTHIHKLAMILAAAKESKLEIRPEHLTEAELILDTVEAGLPNIYRIIMATTKTQLTLNIISAVQKHGQIALSDLYHSMMHTTEYNDFRAGVDAAMASGKVRLIVHNSRAILKAA